MITMILLLVATIIAGILLLIGGASILVIFGDLIVFVLIVRAIARAISKK